MSAPERVAERVWIPVLVALWVAMLLWLRVAEAVASALLVGVGVGLRVGAGVALRDGLAVCVVEWEEVMAAVGVPERLGLPLAVAGRVAVGGFVREGLLVGLQVATRPL